LISTRFGVVVSLLLAVAALALAIVAFMSTVRDDGPIRGRLVQSQITNEYDGAPVVFTIDDFFIGRGTDSVLHAFYVYPPGYYGHARGCKIVWDPAATVATVATPAGPQGPGLFVDPCGGARFTRDGKLVSGPADHDLDFFATSAAVDGTVVDTRRLLCGAGIVSSATPAEDEPTATPTPEPGTKTCDRVSPDTKRP
jgi:hypothetical protein